MNTIKQGVLILSHCGYSFIEDLTRIVCDKGLESFVLSSRPIEKQSQRINYLYTLANDVFITNTHELRWEDIENTILKLSNTGKQIVACISVWEGYRALMSHVNRLIANAEDLSQETVLFLRDKLALRKKLRESGLSDVNVDLLTKENFNKSKQVSLRKFIKPRYGIASFGTFLLRSEMQWSVIEHIKNQIRNDAEYQSIFGNDIELILEDYIEGDEFSFEVIVFDGKPYVIAIHEKIELQEESTTLLENACISPPENLSVNDILYAANWIEFIFNHLNVHTGCFHVEARRTAFNWEIIEINPRVGGAFISQSVEILTKGHHPLRLWLECLLAKNVEMKDCLKSTLRHISTMDVAYFSRNQNTFFRVFFANQAGTVKEVSIKNIDKTPHIIKSFVKQGQQLNKTSREYFIGQALWKFTDSERTEIPNILNESKNLIEVIYE